MSINLLQKHAHLVANSICNIATQGKEKFQKTWIYNNPGKAALIAAGIIGAYAAGNTIASIYKQALENNAQIARTNILSAESAYANAQVEVQKSEVCESHMKFACQRACEDLSYLTKSKKIHHWYAAGTGEGNVGGKNYYETIINHSNNGNYNRFKNNFYSIMDDRIAAKQNDIQNSYYNLNGCDLVQAQRSLNISRDVLAQARNLNPTNLDLFPADKIADEGSIFSPEMQKIIAKVVQKAIECKVSVTSYVQAPFQMLKSLI